MQEFDLLVKDKNGVENTVFDHLSKITFASETIPISDTFSDDSLMVVGVLPWFSDIVNYLAVGEMPSH